MGAGGAGLEPTDRGAVGRAAGGLTGWGGSSCVGCGCIRAPSRGPRCTGVGRGGIAPGARCLGGCAMLCRRKAARPNEAAWHRSWVHRQLYIVEVRPYASEAGRGCLGLCGVGA